MTRKYFGTDGIRGRVGDKQINPIFMLKLGWAAGIVLTKHLKGHNKGRVILGKDTRNSGYMFESALEAGLSAAGIDTFLTGPLPTPAIAYMTRALRMDAGVVLSASHNPYYDNGIKFFGPDGHKLSDEIELEIEKMIDSDFQIVANELLGRAKRIEDATPRYIEFCKAGLNHDQNLNNLHLVVDCANGAGYKVAPAVFRELGAKVTVIGDQPNGFNINQGCGSTDLALIKATVINERADLGIALDGDGDRLIMIDRFGNHVDGDQIIYIIANYHKQRNNLTGGVVGTIMSNQGLEVALQKLEIPFKRAQVSDRYVIQMMLENNWHYGAENSGHVINYKRNTTGDGIVAAVAVLKAMIYFGKSLDQLTAQVPLFPQILINVNLEGLKDQITELDAVKQAIATAEKTLSDSGRLLIRKSGTEPLIRVMTEHPDLALAQQTAEMLAAVIKQQVK